ncbi:unnamed protein product [Amoebophrya sp. A25]|nr:unnamed protein product [Amoebophrya sp. A25]|eukprot:GSA25T00004888001.1
MKPASTTRKEGSTAVRLYRQRHLSIDNTFYIQDEYIVSNCLYQQPPVELDPVLVHSYSPEEEDPSAVRRTSPVVASSKSRTRARSKSSAEDSSSSDPSKDSDNNSLTRGRGQHRSSRSSCSTNLNTYTCGTCPHFSPNTMVYFICQGCQETLKKPAVRKHLSTRCWGAAMTCVDCSVCFAGDTWECHTVCISEEKKFHGCLYQEKMDKAPKGQLKQESWTKNLEKALELSKGSRVEKWMEKIVAFDNVPRKKAGFANFVKNSCRVSDEKAIAMMWGFVEQSNPSNANQAGGNKDGAVANGANGGSTAAKSARPRGRWLGWEKEIDATLGDNGDAMEWAELAETLAERYEQQAKAGVVKKRKRDVLADLVLSNVPEKYLSKDCSKVRKVA